MGFIDILSQSIKNNNYNYNKVEHILEIPYREFNSLFQRFEEGIIQIYFNEYRKYIDIDFLIEQFTPGVKDTPACSVNLNFENYELSIFDYHTVMTNVIEFNIPMFKDDGTFECPFSENILHFPAKLLFEDIKNNKKNVEDLFLVLSHSVEHYIEYLGYDEEGKQLFIEMLKLN